MTKRGNSIGVLAFLCSAMSAWPIASLGQDKPAGPAAEASSQATQKAEKPRIAVADFEITGDVGIAEAGKAVSELLLTEFNRDRFQVVERSLLAAILKEKDLTIAKVTGDPAILRGKNLKGVRYLVLGSVVKLGNLAISARLVDVGTGDIVQTAKVSAKDAQGLQDALGQLARELQMTDEEKKDREPKVLVTVELRTERDGLVTYKVTEKPVGPKQPAVFTDLPGDVEAVMEFRPAEGEEKPEAEKIAIDLRKKGKKVWCFYASSSPLVEQGSGVPPAALVKKGQSDWDDNTKETAFVAGVVDGLNRIGEKAVKYWESNDVNPLWSAHMEDIPKEKAIKVSFSFVVGGVAVSAKTHVKDFVTEEYLVAARFPFGREGRGTAVTARDFILEDYKEALDGALPEKIRSFLKDKGVGVKTEYQKDFICRVELSFRGLVIIHD